MDDARALALLKLQSWLTPSFPVGAFSYSHGLEWAVETGLVRDGAGLRQWVDDVLTVGSGRSDAILLAASHSAYDDPERLALIGELALALAPSRERLLETQQQGTSFRDVMLQAWPTQNDGTARQSPLGAIAYPIALGMAAGTHGIALADALPAFLNAFASNLVSAAIRLSVIGQTEAQAIIASLLPTVQSVAMEAQHATLDDLGNGALGVDFASMLHETQYSRLFRS